MKKILKQIFLAAGTLFLVQQSYNTLSVIHEFNSDSWLLMIFMAWIINLFVTGVFALPTFAFSVQKLLPDSYYKIRNPRKLKTFFKKINGELFRKFLLATLWKSQKQRAKHFDGTVKGIENLETQSKKAEFGHLIPFIFLVFIAIYLVFVGQWKLAIPTLLINIIGNFYPIILQRHHRMRTSILKKRYGLI